MLFKIARADSDNYIISIVYSEYSKTLINSLKGQVINIFYGALFVIALVLFVWVSSLIKPLKLIKNYIDDIKEDKESTLHIDRRDEIGIVSSSLIEMKEEIDKQNEIKEEMIHNISHDLKTPIALIQGYAEGLQESISDNPEDMDYYCDVIIDEAGKMNKMVKNLLTLNQLEFGDGSVNMERFDIISVIAGVIHSMQIKANEKQVNIEFNQMEPIYVWADEFQIEEVITNYLSNALNHVDENRIIQVKIQEKNGIVRVSVFNTGKNIPENELDNIWIKFYKVDKARTRAYGGNGIGLSIVKAIMDRHEKKCGAINRPDGVEFWFELDCKSLEKGTE